jgi:hypothetical protein
VVPSPDILEEHFLKVGSVEAVTTFTKVLTVAVDDVVFESTHGSVGIEVTDGAVNDRGDGPGFPLFGEGFFDLRVERFGAT